MGTRSRSIAPFGQWPESRKKLRKHRLRAIPTIEAVFGFLGVFPQVFAAHMNVGAVDRPL